MLVQGSAVGFEKFNFLPNKFEKLTHAYKHVDMCAYIYMRECVCVRAAEVWQQAGNDRLAKLTCQNASAGK